MYIWKQAHVILDVLDFQNGLFVILFLFVLIFLHVLCSVAQFISISATKDVVAIHKTALGQDIDAKMIEIKTVFLSVFLNCF